MSGMYYRVTPEPEKAEGYGFKKVNQAELSGILDRITKPTYSSRVQRDEAEQVHNYRRIRSAPPPRTPSSCHRRRVSYGHRSERFQNDGRLSEFQLQRLVRRVQKPTQAFTQRYYEPSEAGEGGGIGGGGVGVGDNNDSKYTFYNNNHIHNGVSRSKKLTPSERKKAFDQLSRPTTATRAKSIKECHLCDPDDAENISNLDVPFDYPYADDQSATKEEVASIVSRISYPTKASEKGIRPCWKTPPNLKELRHMNEGLPLVSGMERSRSVAQIVNRLHVTKGNYIKRNHHGYSTQATPTTNFEATPPQSR